MKLPALFSAFLLLACPALRAADAIPDNVVFEPGVEYAVAGGEHLQVDLARPKNGDGPFPAIVCIHGGGFRAGKREGYDKLCVTLAQQGYVAITVTYRLAPAFPFPAAVQDCKAAVRWLRANAAKYHVDPARIGVTGGSAGGHLAQFLGVTMGVKEFEGDGGNLDQSSNVACVVNFYGPSDFTKSYGKSVDAAEVLPLWLGGDLEHARAAHIRSQPAELGHAGCRAHALLPRHRRRSCRLRAGRLDDRPAQVVRRGGGIAHARRRRPRLQRRGRRQSATGAAGFLREAPQAGREIALEPRR